MYRLPSLGRNKDIHHLQKGQALIIVLLVLSVSLAVVLSVVSRSVTDISVTTYEEDAARAFSAAEAGIEEALISGTDSGGETPLPNDATYNTVIEFPSGGSSFDYPNPLSSGELGTVWFVEHTTDGNSLTCSGSSCTTAPNLEVCWGTPGASGAVPAVEIIVFYDDTGSPPGSVASPNDYSGLKIKRYTADPATGSRTTPNNFDSAGTSCGISGSNYAYNATMSVGPDTGCNVIGQGCLVMARVRMLYNNSVAHPLGFRVFGGGGGFPAQGARIDSVGTAGDSTRKVVVRRGFSQPPGIFDSAIFSYSDLTK